MLKLQGGIIKLPLQRLAALICWSEPNTTQNLAVIAVDILTIDMAFVLLYDSVFIGLCELNLSLVSTYKYLDLLQII